MFARITLMEFRLTLRELVVPLFVLVLPIGLLLGFGFQPGEAGARTPTSAARPAPRTSRRSARASAWPFSG